MSNVCPLHVHEAIKRDRSKWKSLPYVGHQFINGRPIEEVRNCTCQSTIYCQCDPDDEREILELMPILMCAIQIGLAWSGKVAIDEVTANMRQIGIVESHSREAIRRLHEEGKVEYDPYYDDNNNRVFNRQVWLR